MTLCCSGSYQGDFNRKLLTQNNSEAVIVDCEVLPCCCKHGTVPRARWEDGGEAAREAHMTLSARASQARQVTGAPVSSTAARASSPPKQAGAQMRTTPARSAVAAFWPPGENAAATTGASCPCSSSDCSTISAMAPSSCWPLGVTARGVCPSVLLEGRLEPSEANGVPLSGLQEKMCASEGSQDLHA